MGMLIHRELAEKQQCMSTCICNLFHVLLKREKMESWVEMKKKTEKEATE